MKKLFALFLTALLALTLTACAGNSERYQSAMKTVTGHAAPLPDEKESDSPVEEADPAAVQPEDFVPFAPQEGWPEGLPRVEEFAKEYRFIISDSVFHATYFLTQPQIYAWEQALAKAGFSGYPAVNGKLQVTYTSRPYTAIAGMQCLEIEVTKYQSPPVSYEWPQEFAVFPQYQATGEITGFEVYTDRQARVLQIQIKDEPKEQVAAYIKQLQQAGYEDFGYGNYTKIAGNMTYEFQSDGIWETPGVATLRYYVY